VPALLTACSLALLLAAAPAPAGLLPFAESALASEPQARIEDAYKWLFHATRGGEHLVRDEEAARSWLEREWESLGPPEAGEPLVVPLRPDGAVVRLNLRPFKARGGSPEALFLAFVRSARSFHATGGEFEAAWDALGARLAEGPLGKIDAAAWQRLDAATRPKGFPAVHHSPEYEAARRPAYRVLTGDEARSLAAALAR
jgi:hypothetical protein